MSSLSRRIVALGAGVSVFVLESLTVPLPAVSGGLTDTKQQCRAYGGTPQYDQDSQKYWCETPGPDKKCERELNDEFAYYDVNSGQCEGCFLTTACTEAAGLADDCWELATLRRFRDGALAAMPGGAADVARYYETAPAIVARIAGRADARRELARLYALYVLPSAVTAALGLDRIARRIYTAMMRDLEARYA
ncbi:MAG: CFI-box-CTERM domain-containing protein [Flavobacteriaceae bacterium]